MEVNRKKMDKNCENKMKNRNVKEMALENLGHSPKFLI